MSNSLQLGMAIAGGLVLAGVIAYNTWNARRHEPRQPRPDTLRHRPDASAGHRIEPGLDGLSADAGEPGMTSEAGPSAQSDVLPVAPPAVLARMGHLDDNIDCVTAVALDGRIVSGDALLAAMPHTRRVGSKPFAVEARREGGQGWEYPLSGQRYQAVQLGVQLANRTGALNEIEFSEFVVVAQHFADAIGGALDLPDMLPVVAQARELDHFASQHDAQLSFTVRTTGAAWSHGFVQQHAASLGFVPGAVAGRMVLPSPVPDAAHLPLLTLSFEPQGGLWGDSAQLPITEIVLGLDVPQVDPALQPFEALREVAHSLAVAMDGVITDDTGQPLRPDIIDSIGRDLHALYVALQEHDLPAGSPQARRLFS